MSSNASIGIYSRHIRSFITNFHNFMQLKLKLIQKRKSIIENKSHNDNQIIAMKLKLEQKVLAKQL